VKYLLVTSQKISQITVYDQNGLLKSHLAQFGKELDCGEEIKTSEAGGWIV